MLLFEMGTCQCGWSDDELMEHALLGVRRQLPLEGGEGVQMD